MALPDGIIVLLVWHYDEDGHVMSVYKRFSTEELREIFRQRMEDANKIMARMIAFNLYGGTLYYGSFKSAKRRRKTKRRSVRT